MNPVWLRPQGLDVPLIRSRLIATWYQAARKRRALMLPGLALIGDHHRSFAAPLSGAAQPIDIGKLIRSQSVVPDRHFIHPAIQVEIPGVYRARGVYKKMERKTGLGPATPTLAR